MESTDLQSYYAHPPCVIINLTDRCNLTCSFCSKGVPLQAEEEKRDLSLREIERIGELLDGCDYDILKISGGEPTLHRDFVEITRRLPDLFPGKKYYLATNGAGLFKARDVLDVYDRIDLSYYPEQESQSKYYSKARGLVSLHSNIVELAKGIEAEDPANKSGWAKDTKDGFATVDDTRLFPNFGRTEVFQKCGFRHWRVIVQDRIYPCCVSSGLSEVRGIPRSKLSVPFDSNWKNALADLESSMSSGACQQCWVDCEKWKFHPKVDLFSHNDSGTGPSSKIPDIVLSSALHLGEGWGVLERFDDDIFRWVENDAEIIVQPGAQPAHIAFEIEPGPGLGGGELALEMLDSAGVQVGSQVLSGRQTAGFFLPVGSERPERFRLHSEGGGHRISSDPRILNFRVFSVVLTESANDKSIPATDLVSSKPMPLIPR